MIIKVALKFIVIYRILAVLLGGFRDVLFGGLLLGPCIDLVFRGGLVVLFLAGSLLSLVPLRYF